ncbi:MAG TPA: copper resistance CopC family protein [Streptosporangiaceae bacterium]|jgi:hypothetical protein
MRSSARICATLVTTLLALLVGAAIAGPASAHTTLKSASPASGSTVGPPSQIVLTYADPVRFTQVLVTDAAGRRYQSGRPVNVDNTVTEQVASSLPNGRYTVAWRVVAPDGHPVEGTYQFTVTGSAATAAPAPAGGQAGKTNDSGPGAGIWWIAPLILLLGGGAAAALFLTGRSKADDDAEVEANQ